MAPQKSPAGDANPTASVDSKQVDAWEQQAMEKVRASISALEDAIAAYEGAKSKPEVLEERYRKFKKMHEALTRWTRDFLTVRETLTLEQRMQRLQQLVYISLYGEL